MTDIAGARINIQTEEVSFRSAVSEGTNQRLGGAVNFINEKQAQSFQFNANGRYESGSGTTGLEGLFPIHFDQEIASITIGNIVPGSSGTTTIDVHLISGSGNDVGTIFTVKPSVDSTAPSNAYASFNFVDSTSSTSTGIILPTMAITNFDKFDCFRFDLDSTMTGAENCFLVIHMRPR